MERKYRPLTPSRYIKIDINNHKINHLSNAHTASVYTEENLSTKPHSLMLLEVWGV